MAAMLTAAKAIAASFMTFSPVSAAFLLGGFASTRSFYRAATLSGTATKTVDRHCDVIRQGRCYRALCRPPEGARIRSTRLAAVSSSCTNLTVRLQLLWCRVSESVVEVPPVFGA